MQEAKPILIGSKRPVKLTISERFNQKWTPEPNSGCHLWIGLTSRTGYGRFGIRASKLGSNCVYAHRLAWEIHNGSKIPPCICVCHRCDTPCCVNPDHLFLGTSKENIEDADRKGRRWVHKGESHYHAKLTALDVLEIRRSSARQIDLAVKFGVSRPHISYVQRGLKWSHVK